MDAHVFRHISRLLGERLHHARLQRIHEPTLGVTVFSFYSSGCKQCLVFRAHRSAPLLFLTNTSPLQNPPFPPASTMRLRKYAEGRVLGKPLFHWVARQMAFPLPGAENTIECWLLLDCKHGASIIHALPDFFDQEPVWPEASLDLLGKEGGANAWRQYQVLTPCLRQTLTSLDLKDGAALIVDLEAGQGDLFWYGSPESPDTLSAWPLPVEQGRSEKVTPVTPQAVFPLLESMQLPLLLALAKTTTDAPAQKQDKTALRRRKRLLANLSAEQERLEKLLALGEDARLLQAHLWRFPPEAQLAEILLPLNPAAPNGEARTIELSPLITVTENMQAMFRKAGKATRGLAILKKRTELVKETSIQTATPATNMPTPGKKGKQGKKSFSPARIQEFISSDGFTLWRGRSAEGNRDLLKLARPFDLWFHVEDGPSAHLILRRNHAAQEVPEQTLYEAGTLVGLKSWRKLDPKAPVMIALAKHVQSVKGAQAGTVRVQETMRTVLVNIDASVENRLLPSPISPSYTPSTA